VIEARAMVVHCEGDLADVETEGLTACGKCSAGQGCGAGVLARVFGSRRSRLRVVNTIQAARGEMVVIGVPETGLVTASLLLYMAPLLGLILFALLGQVVAESLGYSAAEWPSILAGGIGLAVGLAGARRLGRSERRLTRTRPVVLRREPLPVLTGRGGRSAAAG